MEQGSPSLSTGTSDGDGFGKYSLQSKHKVFLSHSGAQKGFVEQLCVDLERCDRYPFFDKRWDCLPIGKEFPRLIFEAIEQCEVGVVVLSEDFFCSKWPMLELVAMANVKKRKPNFSIMPIFFGISISQCREMDNHKRWLSLWHKWAEHDSRIDVKDWENALHLFGPTNGLKYNFDLGEVKFREEIVEAICKLVPSRTRFEDSHVQGKSRLCKVIHEKITESRVSLSPKVHVVGIYGVGGIGKTTICKAMCNNLSEEYQDKVCHVELGNRSEEEVFKEVLGRLTDKNLERLGAMSVDEYRDHLMRDMRDVKVFLTIDNVSRVTSKEAMILLRANYGLGSVLLVTARSMDELTSLGIDSSECMEMPELELEEARSLFLYHVICVPPSYSSNKDDLDLIASCIERCHFKKGDGTSYHYHPLALQVLGEQLQCIGYAPSQWTLLLHEVDFLNPFGEPQHPVFSILRRSFDALNPQDQLLFMDVALFSPYRGGNTSFKWNEFKWFGEIHKIPMIRVMGRLDNLRRKSLLENLGDGFGRIGMHDLWREFAKLETKFGDFEKRRWIFEWDEEADVTNGGHVRRMYFLDKGFMKLEDINFVSFPNVNVLKFHIDFANVEDLDFSSVQGLDLRGLKHLRSLELESSSYQASSRRLISIVGLQFMSKLVFLRWLGIPTDPSCIDEISCLTNLQVLDLCRCNQFPDLSTLILLQVVCFRDNKLVATIVGFSSKHSNLQFLDLSNCQALESCWGIGELVALQELKLDCCCKLKEVPNLQNLKLLRKLHVSGCMLLSTLPGLGDLVSLLELNAVLCYGLKELPSMHNLKNLKKLNLCYCKLIKSLPGLDELVCLLSLQTLGCKNLTQLPNMYKLTNLQSLKLDPEVVLQSFTGWTNLISLWSLRVGIGKLQEGFNLCKLTKLERLHIYGGQGQGFSSLAELVLLEFVMVNNYKGLRALPNLEKLSRLRTLEFRSCEFEELSGLCVLISLEDLSIINCNKLEVIPNLQGLTKLEKLRVEGCAQLRDLNGTIGLRNLKSLWVVANPWLHKDLGSSHQWLIGLYSLDLSNGRFIDVQGLASCSQLRTLWCRWLPIQELPDLANFSQLSHLNVRGCMNLKDLTCTRPLCSNFETLDVHGCKRLQALPDLTNSRKMQLLDVANSGVVLSAQDIEYIKARWPSIYLFTEESPSQERSRESSLRIWLRSLGRIK